jgi:hypothetical protein
MSFNKRFVSTSQLLERYQNSNFSEVKAWMVNPDALIFTDNSGGTSIANQCYRLITDRKDEAAEQLLIDSVKELKTLQGQLQVMMESFTNAKDSTTKDYLFSQIKELENQIKKFL